MYASLLTSPIFLFLPFLPPYLPFAPRACLQYAELIPKEDSRLSVWIRCSQHNARRAKKGAYTAAGQSSDISTGDQARNGADRHPMLPGFDDDEDETERPDEETLLLAARKQRLQASIHYSVQRLTRQILADNKVAEDVVLTPQFVRAVSSIVWNQARSMALDLDAFAKHGKRSLINADDVKLCVRRNPAMVDHLTDYAAGLKKTKGGK